MWYIMYTFIDLPIRNCDFDKTKLPTNELGHFSCITLMETFIKMTYLQTVHSVCKKFKLTEYPKRLQSLNHPSIPLPGRRLWTSTMNLYS